VARGLTWHVSAAARELAGSAGARLLPSLGIAVSRLPRWGPCCGSPSRPGGAGPTATASEAPGRTARRTGLAAAAEDLRARLPGQLQPARPLHQPGRPDSDHQHLSPRQAASILLTRPDLLTGRQADTLARIQAVCPEMIPSPDFVRHSRPCSPHRITTASSGSTSTRAADLPHLHSFTRSLDPDILAATAALTLPFHNGRTEGVNTTTIQDDQTADVRTSGLRPAPPQHPPQLRLRTVTTESATEPCICSLREEDPG
jgi:hypothetical protein